MFNSAIWREPLRTFPWSYSFRQMTKQPIIGAGFPMKKRDAETRQSPITGGFLRYPRMRMPGRRLSKDSANGMKESEMVRAAEVSFQMTGKKQMRCHPRNWIRILTYMTSLLH